MKMGTFNLREGDSIPFNNGCDVLTGSSHDHNGNVLSMKQFIKIPNSEKMMEYVDPITFESSQQMCAMWIGHYARLDGRHTSATLYIPTNVKSIVLPDAVTPCNRSNIGEKIMGDDELVSIEEFMNDYWEENNKPNVQPVSALDGFADVELRASELAWNKKSEDELMKAKPSILRDSSSGSVANYANIYPTTSSDPHSFNKAEEIDPYADYDRAMGMLEPRY